VKRDAIADLPHLPRDDEGPVFREPWEAQAFAMAVRLHEQGHFTWAEWAKTLSEEIARAQREGDPDLGTTYYRHWLRAIERIAEKKQWLVAAELEARAEALRGSAGLEPHDHDHEDHAH
jgi:nitrile hydratase accessory protein